MKNKIIFFLIIVSVVVTAIFVSIRKNKSRCEDCNIVIISLSNTRKINMSAYNYFRKTTPYTDKFFQNGFIFKNAITPASLTFTDSISLFFSLHPYTHKLFNRFDKATAAEVLKNKMSLPKQLERYGYVTAAFVSDEDYAFDYGLGKEFQHYFDRSMYRDYGISYRPFRYEIGTKDLITPAIDWLKKNNDKKFFLFFQAYDMHCPYTPTKKFKEIYETKHNESIDFNNCYMTLDEVKKVKKNNKDYFQLDNWYSFLNKDESAEPILFDNEDIQYLKNLYDAELTEADFNLSRLYDYFKQSGLDKNTIFIFMSEHGDYLGENGYFMKASVKGRGNVHNANLGFPLLLKVPDSISHFTQEQLTSIMDIAPSLLELVGITPPKDFEGVSFSKELGTQKEFNQYIFSGTKRIRKDRTDNGLFVIESLQDHEYKMNYFKTLDARDRSLKSEQFEFYNLKQDPNELKDLSSTNVTEFAKYRQMLKNVGAKYNSSMKK